MSEANGDTATVDATGDDGRVRRSNKRFWRKKKKTQHNQTAKIQGATPEFKGSYVATHEEAPGKAEMMCKIFK